MGFLLSIFMRSRVSSYKIKSEEPALPFPQFSYTAFKNRKGIPRHLMNN